MKKVIATVLIVAAAGAALLLLIQLIPINRVNPPVVTQVKWDSPQTQALFQRACSDCHSNETVWPWYSRLAPVSWLVARDVNNGRRRFNISNLDTASPRFNRLSEEIARVMQRGEMPMGIYVSMHPAARLTPDEQQALVNGLQATLANGPTSSK